MYICDTFPGIHSQNSVSDGNLPGSETVVGIRLTVFHGIRIIARNRDGTVRVSVFHIRLIQVPVPGKSGTVAAEIRKTRNVVMIRSERNIFTSDDFSCESQ